MNEDQAKQMLRRQNSIENTLNQMFKDREILEDILIRVGTLEDKIKLLTDRIANLEKNTKADMKDMHEKVVEDVTQIISE